MIKLSVRMLHLADMVPQDAILADVGTDHGYIPIYLVQSGRVSRAFAMDIKEGPLLRARGHIRAFGLDAYITVRRSDGVMALAPKEADTILAAGMGGGVILHILEEGKAVIAAARGLILQPQSEIERVRRYLYEQGYAIEREDMVFEDGKYYPMMYAVPDTEEAVRKKYAAYSKRQQRMYCCYGERLLTEHHAVAGQYLEAKIRQYESLLKGLFGAPQTNSVRKRTEQLAEELNCARDAFACWKEE